MSLDIGHVTINSTDAIALAAWWAEVLGGTVEDPYGGWFVKVNLPTGPGVAVQKVENPMPGGRVHLDLVAEDLAVETERLLALGARVVAERGEPGGFRWTVFADVDGNEFCVVPG
ncbi:VOC family protein [Nocardioides yefusunii]|uniref:VOC family protein n=1 Tax=Nocardioides yefusunii TaxID=2500546 RepID=A0ABW1R2B5_9ACTN|nr:VOC family protein [Nocardioides yefusunii]